MKWLPRLRWTTKPSCSRKVSISFPETTGSLGKGREVNILDPDQAKFCIRNFLFFEAEEGYFFQTLIELRQRFCLCPTAMEARNAAEEPSI